jgi:hypothetical protein
MASSPWLAPLRPVGRFGETLLDRVLCVLGAIGLSQAPEFFQQYLQRLGGHLDEARRHLAGYETVARQSGLSLQELIDTTRAQAAEPVARLGALIEEAAARVDALSAAETALRGASVWDRPFVFMSHLDPSIAARTWEVFKPAVPVTPEGFVYALAGMVLALALYHLVIAWPCRVLWRRRAARREAARG